MNNAASSEGHNHSRLQARFLSILPRIKTHARIYFRGVKCYSKKSDFVAEVVALCWKWWLRLVERNKNPNGFVSTLATYAARAVRSGRRVTGQLKAKDVLSERAQQLHDFTVTALPLSTRTSHENLHDIGGQRRIDEFEERLQDNTRTRPDEQAVSRFRSVAMPQPIHG